jgi:IPT/TIG domain
MIELMRVFSAAKLLLAVLLIAAVLPISCGGGGGGGGPIPTPTTPLVIAVSPNSGTTLGGTPITITGENFAAGAQVSVGGAAATNVIVTSLTTLTATTSTRSAGTVEVTVTLNGRSGSLPAGFTYVAPSQITNEPPVIQSVSAQGVKPNEPGNFADLSEEIAVTATVTDAETTPDRLVYEWSGTDGEFIGTGPSAKWRAPASGSTPFVANLKLTVVDRYQTTDGSGLPITFEHRVEKAFTVKVHDSAKEVGGMATLFLENFSKSSVAPAIVMKDFLVGCYGTEAELKNVQDNRAEYTITSSSVGPAVVTVNFGGVCAIRDRPGDACSNSAVRWESTKKSNGDKEAVEGTDQVAAVYRNSRWWLCDSQFEGKRLLGTGFYELLTR